MSEQIKTKLMWLVVLLLIIGAVVFVVIESKKPGKYDEFAQCLTEKGAVFYGAFWCPHCQEQKAMFRSSVKKLTYVECSAPNGKSQLPVCTEKGVTQYPTWIFADGEVFPGQMTFDQLSEKTGCVVPK